MTEINMAELQARLAAARPAETELFKRVLGRIEQYDSDYGRRYPLVLTALATAGYLGVPAGVNIDPSEPHWPGVVYIDLPTGQVSWHIPFYPYPWDGHSTPEKYERIRRYTQS